MSDGFDRSAHAAGHSDPDLALEAQAHAVFLALPDTGVHNAFPRIIEFDVLKVLETPIEDFEAVLCTGRITAGAHHGAEIGRASYRERGSIWEGTGLVIRQ